MSKTYFLPPIGEKRLIEPLPSLPNEHILFDMEELRREVDRVFYAGLRFVICESGAVPNTEAHFYQGGKLVGRIVDMDPKS